MRLHALVADLETARRAVEGGATVVQLRLKGAPTGRWSRRAAAYRQLCQAAGIAFVVNDDVDAALRLEADGVHLGRSDEGATPRSPPACSSASPPPRPSRRWRPSAGAGYVGAGPVWQTPTKPDAGEPIGLERLAAIAAAVSIPTVAIGGVDATNAADCVEAGAAGVAVVRAAGESRALREAVDAALAAR